MMGGGSRYIYVKQYNAVYSVHMHKCVEVMKTLISSFAFNMNTQMATKIESVIKLILQT